MLLSESSHFTFVYDDPEYSLVVLNACPDHSGVYTCTAKNLAGSNSCKAELTVHTGLLSDQIQTCEKDYESVRPKVKTDKRRKHLFMIHCKSVLY